MNRHIKTSIRVFAFSLSCAFFFSCDNSFEKEIPVRLGIDMSGDIIQGNSGCLVIDENNPNNRYSRIDSIRIYGFGFDFFLPDSLKNCNLKLMVSGKMRETESITGNIAFSLQNSKDSISFWGMLVAENYVKQANTWVAFKDSLIIPANANVGNSKLLKVFSGKGKGKGFFDVDDLKVELIKE
jgi:hypothetical protein